MTPHNSAEKGDFASTVIMPGDPLRSKFIAENFLDDAKLVNNVRGVNGYTGYYNGKRVSVMASGMGMPAIGIYSYELFNFYDVQSIIRTGSAGAGNENIKVRDIVIGTAMSYSTSFMDQYDLPGHYSPSASFRLLKKADEKASELNLSYHIGPMVSGDVFYRDKGKDNWSKMGIIGTEMEGAALYAVAARAGKEALCICTISDSSYEEANMSPEEREQSFTDMIKLALEIAD